MKHHQRRLLAIPLLALVLALYACLLVPARAASAHPAPSVLHDYVLSLTPTSLELVSYLRVSPELAGQVYRQIDTDGDNATSEDERQAWYREHPSKLRLFLNAKELKLSISQAPSISYQDLLASISKPVEVVYRAAWTEPLEGNQRVMLNYGDSYMPYDEYYVSVANDLANDGLPHNIARPQYPAEYQIIYQIKPQGSTQPAPEGQLAAAPVTQPGQASSAGAGAAATPQAQTNSAPSAAIAPAGGSWLDSGRSLLFGTLRDWRGDAGAATVLLAVALLVGALHALTPGHGKAMVAAYLVGSQGRATDAVLLGGVVTLTHTAGVLALGLLLVYASTLVDQRTLQPVLEAASGLLVLGLGAWLITRRWREARAVMPGRSAVPAPVGAMASTPLVARPVQATAGTLVAASSEAYSAPLATGTGHSHEGAHEHPHEHTHGPGGHEHSHGPVGSRVDKRTLLGLGISGGIVPCTDALGVLLLAASVGQVALGLGLVLSFSVGLAAVLIGIGVVLVKTKGALERRYSAPSWSRWVPLASAALVTVIGAAMVISALPRLL
jgi:ABC-type nickel/cobalt efflux system permease component RcnA